MVILETGFAVGVVAVAIALGLPIVIKVLKKYWAWALKD